MASCRNFVKDNPRGGKQVSTSPTNSPRYKTSQIEKDGEIWFCLPSLFVCLVSKYYLLLCKTFYSYLCWSEANYDTLDKYTKRFAIKFSSFLLQSKKIESRSLSATSTRCQNSCLMIFTNAKQCHTHKAIHDDIHIMLLGGRKNSSFLYIYF